MDNVETSGFVVLFFGLGSLHFCRCTYKFCFRWWVETCLRKIRGNE